MNLKKLINPVFAGFMILAGTALSLLGNMFGVLFLLVGIAALGYIYRK